jgi:pantothenate kinase
VNRPISSFSAALESLQTRLSAGRRVMLGVAGAPGAGKSTVAQALCEALPGRAVVVPMDGYHLANSELVRLGRAQRKGAADTFDSAGFAALLCRLRARPQGQVVYAPDFRREIDEAVAGAIAVPDHIALVIAEGNYLLLEQDAWRAARAQLDAVWYIDIDPALRRERLVARHMRYGRTADEARAWVMQTDEPNAQLVQASRVRADLVLA